MPAKKRTRREAVFPEKGGVTLMQSKWGQGWSAYLDGFEWAAEYLGEAAEAGRFGGGVDTVGLAVVFLERQSVELALKGAISDLTKGLPPTGHDIHVLWADFVQRATASGVLKPSEFAEGAECIDILTELDPDSTVFRYPLDRGGTPHPRPEFIDLTELRVLTATIRREILGTLTYLEELDQSMD